MKSIRHRKKNGALVPLMPRSRKKYPFRTPIPPCSVVVVKESQGSLRRGQRFRIGFCSRQDGPNCIWLVHDAGSYEQTINHDFLQEHLEVESASKERSLYGRNRPELQPINHSADQED